LPTPPIPPLALSLHDALPIFVLPGGEVMTESAAITLHLADLAQDDTLVPAPGDPARTKFLRWLVFLVANVYPTYTYADDPSRFVDRKSTRLNSSHVKISYAVF